eukprot:12922155-Alexandrium_andersonii.AAC.2
MFGPEPSSKSLSAARNRRSSETPPHRSRSRRRHAKHGARRGRLGVSGIRRFQAVGRAVQFVMYAEPVAFRGWVWGAKHLTEASHTHTHLVPLRCDDGDVPARSNSQAWPRHTVSFQVRWRAG